MIDTPDQEEWKEVPEFFSSGDTIIHKGQISSVENSPSDRHRCAHVTVSNGRIYTLSNTEFKEERGMLFWRKTS